MGHPNPLDFFATQFFMLPWILMLLQKFDQPTRSPLPCGADHLHVNASPRHDGVRQPGLYCALKCASPPNAITTVASWSSAGILDFGHAIF
ncbi:hypothetical protein MRX96_039403 [Rhipicephalus microplus]